MGPWYLLADIAVDEHGLGSSGSSVYDGYLMSVDIEIGHHITGCHLSLLKDIPVSSEIPLRT